MGGYLHGAFIEDYPPSVMAQEPVEEPREVQIEVKINWTTERIRKEIEKRAVEYGVSAAEMDRVIRCESGYDIDIQSHWIQPYGREQSWGLAQIHLPAHPNVTKEQAIDPEFAIRFMAKHFAQGNHKMWACY